MKLLSFLIISILLVPACVPGQRRLNSDVFKEVSIGKWGVTSFRIPKNLKDESPDPSEVVTQNDKVSWTTYTRTWQLFSDYGSPVFEVNLFVTTWNRSDFSFVPNLRADSATPENLLELDLLSDLNSPDVKESRRMDIDDVKGGFFLADSPWVKDRFMAGWYAYRYYEGKVQRISLSISGRKSELQKPMKIIQSLRLQ